MNSPGQGSDLDTPNSPAPGLADFDPPDEVLEFGGDGRKPPTPGDPPKPWRQNPRHDHVTRARMDQTNSGDDEPDQMTWGDL
jgi:hypothetical protein